MSITYSDHTVPTFSYNDYTVPTFSNDYYTIKGSKIEPNTIYATGTDVHSLFKAYQNTEKKNDIYFKKVIQRNPGRVYEFVFQDDTHIKTVCAEEDLDIFNLKYAFFLALAKYLYKDKYTFIGILNKVPDLMQRKKCIKIVKEGMKLFKEQQKEKEKKEAKEKELKEIKKRKIAKAQEKRRRKKEQNIDVLVKAIQNVK